MPLESFRNSYEIQQYSLYPDKAPQVKSHVKSAMTLTTIAMNLLENTSVYAILTCVRVLETMLLHTVAMLEYCRIVRLFFHFLIR